MVEWMKLLNLLVFTQYKDGHSLKDIALQGEEDLRIEKPIWKLFWKNPKKNVFIDSKIKTI